MRDGQIDGTLLLFLCQLFEIEMDGRVLHGSICTERGLSYALAVARLCLAPLHLRHVGDLGNGLLAMGMAEYQIAKLPTDAFKYGVKTHLWHSVPSFQSYPGKKRVDFCAEPVLDLCSFCAHPLAIS